MPSSSAVYGDEPGLPKVETGVGRPRSPYGASKLMAEIYAQLFYEQFQVDSLGLRYFNLFGPRQNPTGGYAAVIPQWISTLLRGRGLCDSRKWSDHTRFLPGGRCRASEPSGPRPRETAAVSARIFNVALGGSTTLDQLHAPSLSGGSVVWGGEAATRSIRPGAARRHSPLRGGHYGPPVGLGV